MPASGFYLTHVGGGTPLNLVPLGVFRTCRRGLVSKSFQVILAILLGLPLAWLILAGICSLPGLAFSVACGHNAGIWLPLVVPISVFVCWYVLNRLRRDSKVADEGKKNDA